MLGTLVRMAAGGAVFSATNGGVGYAIYKAAQGLSTTDTGAKAAKAVFYGTVGTLGTVAGALELLGLKTFFHDYGNKGAELLGLEGHVVDASPVAKTDVAK